MALCYEEIRNSAKETEEVITALTQKVQELRGYLKLLLPAATITAVLEATTARIGTTRAPGPLRNPPKTPPGWVARGALAIT
uniref:Uncharacterized protein n=1 Tax=Romanomermis culicivorax TaxID=13658 RepID=A0A915IGI8_ROMCU